MKVESHIKVILSIVFLITSGCSMYEFKDPTGAQTRVLYSAPEQVKTAESVPKDLFVSEPIRNPNSLSEKPMPQVRQVFSEKTSGQARTDMLAVLIGISEYKDKALPTVKYAKSDAEMLTTVLEENVGLPKENIKLLTNEGATFSRINAFLEDWLIMRTNATSIVLIYYAGLGFTSTENELYLVPHNGIPNNINGLQSIRKMYESLSNLPAKEIIIIVDGCFSGLKCRENVQVDTTQPSFYRESHKLWNNKIILLTASSWDQPALDYDKVQHGLFTYYLMRGIRGEADMDKEGVVDMGDIYKYVKAQVSNKAYSEFDRQQTPLILPSADIIADRLKTVITAKER